VVQAAGPHGNSGAWRPNINRIIPRPSPDSVKREWIFKEMYMIKLAFIFLIIASVAGVFAFTGIVAAVPGIAQILFYSFLVLFLFALVGLLLSRRKSRSHKL
jgi:uncharacterized membrane protein YtjA (UPF0391 family)